VLRGKFQYDGSNYGGGKRLKAFIKSLRQRRLHNEKQNKIVLSEGKKSIAKRGRRKGVLGVCASLKQRKGSME